MFRNQFLNLKTLASRIFFRDNLLLASKLNVYSTATEKCTTHNTIKAIGDSLYPPLTIRLGVGH